MASFGVYVPDDSELLKRIQSRADEAHDGKVSSYARAAIERDLDGATGPINSKTILVDLARQLLGEPVAENMEILCPPALNQAHELRRILEDYIADKEEKFIAKEDQEEYAKGNREVILDPIIYRVKTPDHILHPGKNQVIKKKA